jgi:G3E family GTPase
VTAEALATLDGVLRRLNPGARIVHATHGRAPLDHIFETRLFDFEQASRAKGWLSVLRGDEQPETEEYGIHSFVFRARRPFHPERFWRCIHDEWPGVLRSKGFFWLATRWDIVGEWSQAGGACRSEPAGLWWAAVPPEEWPTDQAMLRAISADCEGDLGDRRQELVVIGIAMDEADLRARFEACLLTDEEMAAGPSVWAAFRDPFPEWALATDDAV